MAEKVPMLALSPTMETGTIVKWRKKEGDSISTGEVICDVETDKATMEYESTQEGTLLKILAGEGQEAAVEETIAVVGEEGEDISSILKEIGEEKEKKTAEAEPKKAATEEAPAGGPEEKPPSPEKQAAEKAAPEARPAGRKPAAGEHIKASPLARELAQQHDIDLTLVSGSGPEGRVIKRDIEEAIEHPPSRAAAPAGAAGAMKTEEVPLSGKRKTIARRISESKFSAPHYYLRTVVLVDGLMAARNELNRGREDRISLNAFLMKLSAEALKRHRYVNAGWGGDKITLFGSVDIGLAVAQPDGLITPIVRDCGNKGIIQIDGEIKPLVEKALNGSLKPEEFTGATFTISNLGSFGILEFTAIINPPGSAILAVGQIRKEAVVGEDGGITVRSTMTLTLSCDHRVFDGAEGARFLNDLKGMIENPIQALY